MSVAAVPRPLEAYRDDGPIARAIGTLIGRLLRLAPSLFVAAGALPVLALIAATGDGASDAVVGAGVGWFVLVAGLAGGRRDDSRFRWLPAPLLRATEYGSLIWIGAIAGGNSVPAAFALMCALAYRHYDIPYRMRHQSVPPPAWVEAVGGGWAGRLVVAYLLLVLDALPVGFFVLAAVLGAVFVAESVSSWVRRRLPETTLEDDEEEDA